MDYTHHPHTEGLGILSDKNHQGMLLYTTLVEMREPLGLIDQQIIYRDPGEYGKSEQRKKRSIEAKESYKWLESLERTAEVQKECQETKIVSNREREKQNLCQILIRLSLKPMAIGELVGLKKYRGSTVKKALVKNY